MPGLPDHLLSIPPVTRFFIIVSTALSLAISLELIPFSSVIVAPDVLLDAVFTLHKRPSYKKVFVDGALKGYQLFSGFFVVDGLKSNGVLVLLNIYRFYTFSNYLESTPGRFKGNFPDYLWFVLTSGFFLVLINIFFAYCGLQTLYYHSQLLSCMTFLWLRTSMNSSINFMGIVPIKAYYLPLFDLGMAVLTGGPHPADSFSGILAGYLYECVQSDTLPVYNLFPGAYKSRMGSENGRRVGFNVDISTSEHVFTPAIFDLGYLKAPIFFYKLLKYPINTSVRTTAFTNPASSRRPPNPAASRSTAYTSGFKSSFQGKGHRLGS